MAEEYISLKQIDEKSPRSALTSFISLAGDRDVSLYSREDAKLLIHPLELKGNKTTTIRRRINSLSAILNYAIWFKIDENTHQPVIIYSSEADAKEENAQRQEMRKKTISDTGHSMIEETMGEVLSIMSEA